MDAVAAHCNLWCDYVHTQFDPAHLLSELGFTIVFDFVLLWLVWGKILKPRIMKQVHAELDAEHGITHEDHDTSTSNPD
jgi:hypothetical protein